MIELDVRGFAAFGLLLVRPGALVMAAPVFAGTTVPVFVRIGLTLALAIVVAPVATRAAMPGPIGVLVASAGELAVGLALALGLRVLLAAAEMAGHLAGYQMGLSYAATVDPQTGARNNVLAMFYSNVALIVFLGLDGHHTLIEALAASYTLVPLAGAGLSDGLLPAMTSMLGVIFFHGVRIAAPVVTALLLVELGIGIVARAAPALNLMVVGAPIRSIVGLLALALAMQTLPAAIGGAWPAAREAAWRLASALR